MKKSITLIALLICTISFSQKNKMIGASLPDSPVELLLQSSMSSIDSWESLKGKWLFLEFWATWCAPCIAKMPKLNSLQNEMKEENIQFISISPEKPGIVKRFLKRKAIAGWIGVDSDQSFIKALGVKYYPTTILISPNGVVHAYLDASNLDKKTLLKAMNTELATDKRTSKVMEKKVISYKENKQKNLKITDKGATLKKSMVVSNKSDKKAKKKTDKKKNNAVYKIEITKAETTKGFKYTNKKGGKLISTNITLAELLSIACNIPKPLIKGDESILNARYNVNVLLPKGNEMLFEQMLRAAIQKKLDLVLYEEKQETIGYELSAPNGVSKDLYVSSEKRGKASADKGILAATNFSLKFLVQNIEDVLKVNVLDQTNLTEKYDYNLYWEANNPETIISALKEQLGLLLTKKKTVSNILVVKPIALKPLKG